MPGNDERDPLDSWLHQQVDPLPPPPGTFELITRRARRRKLRKLAVTVASAATVAAAAAIAVPNVIALNVKPSHESASSVAQGQSPSPGGRTHQTNGSASPLPSSRPASPSPLTEPAGPVPPNFRPSSVSFVSPDVGWVIGQAGTPGQCANANPDICTSIARTDDAGKTWHGAPAPGTAGPNGPNGVSGIRFLDGVNGWAFGPELWATHDAGRTWTRVDTHGQRVTDLEAAGDRAYALFATCSGTDTFSFADGCTSYTLMTAARNSDNWVPVGGPTSGLPGSGAPGPAVLELTGSAGYLVAPDKTLYSGPLGGTWQRVGTTPCQPGSLQGNEVPVASLFALASSTHLAIACPGTAVSATPMVYTSDDGGASWAQQPASDWPGTSDRGAMTSLTAAPDGTLVLATTHGLYVLPAGAAQWKRVTAAGAGMPAGGFTYVGMTTNGQGVAVPADEKLHEIWMTFDGGLTWAPRTSITPGN